MMGFKVVPGWGCTFAKGFQAAGLFVGIKKAKKDFSVVYSERPCAAAGVFTVNSVRAAPVLLSEQNLAASAGQAQAVAIVSGTANACTGAKGLEDEQAKIEFVAAELGLPPCQVLSASTGVIGRPLPVDRILAHASGLEQVLSSSQEAGLDAAQAILTTDSTEKLVAIQCKGFRVAGMAKGSGMIHPNMATMLAVITTDAQVEAKALQQALKSAVDKTFNLISVDGDTSTNDSVFLLANGASGTLPFPAAFQEALDFVCLDLARKIVLDGEGATKLFTVTVEGAKDLRQASAFAKAIVSSSLVKAAIHGADPNWGRIFSAMGSTRQAFDLKGTALWLGPVKVFGKGKPVAFDAAAVQGILSAKEIRIKIRLSQGQGVATAFGCDLSADYVKINAAYCT